VEAALNAHDLAIARSENYGPCLIRHLHGWKIRSSAHGARSCSVAGPAV